MQVILKMEQTLSNFPYKRPVQLEAVDKNRVHFCVADDVLKRIYAEVSGVEHNNSNFDGLYMGNWYIQPPNGPSSVRCGGLTIAEDMDRLYALLYYPVNADVPRTLKTYDNLDRYSAWISRYSISGKVSSTYASIPLFGLLGHEANAVGPEGLAEPVNISGILSDLEQYGIHGRTAGSINLTSNCFGLVCYRGYLLAFFPMRFLRGSQATYTVVLLFRESSTSVEGVGILNICTASEEYNPFAYNYFIFDGMLYAQVRSELGKKFEDWDYEYQQDMTPGSIKQYALYCTDINNLIRRIQGRTTKNPIRLLPFMRAFTEDVKELLEPELVLSVDKTQRTIYAMSSEKQQVSQYALVHYILEMQDASGLWLPFTSGLLASTTAEIQACRLRNRMRNMWLSELSLSLTSFPVQLGVTVAGPWGYSLGPVSVGPGDTLDFWVRIPDGVFPPATADFSVTYTVVV